MKQRDKDRWETIYETTHTAYAAYGHVQYLWGKVCRWWSHPYARSLGHEDRAGHILECPSPDIRHIQGPRLHPLSSSRHPHAASLRWEPHSAHPHGWGNTAPYAGLKVTHILHAFDIRISSGINYTFNTAHLDSKVTSIPLHVETHIHSTHQCTSCRWHQQSFLEGTGRKRSPVCWCTCHWYTLRETLDTHPHLTVNREYRATSTTGPVFHLNELQVNFWVYMASKQTLPSQTFPLILAKPLLQIGSEKRRAHNTMSVNAVIWFTEKCKMVHIDHLTFFTFCTWAVPGFSQCGTAVGLQRSPVDVDLTTIIYYLQPAGALSSLCFNETNLLVTLHSVLWN